MYIYGVMVLLSELRIRRFPSSIYGRSKEWWTYTSLMAVGLVYGSIHFYITATCSNSRCRMKNWTHAFIGANLFVCGALRFLLTLPHVEHITVDFSVPFAFAGIGLALAFHLDNNLSANEIHITFALAMLLTGITFAVSSKWQRWSVLHGLCAILSSALLSASSDDIVEASASFGISNLIMLCVFFTVFHVMGLLYYSYWSGIYQSYSPLRPSAA